jgi:uncharacterized phage-like protein YoqJ
MIIAGTGHRPPTLGLTYQTQDRKILESFAIDSLRKHAITEIISGMANGWDQALTYVAIELGISFTAAVPFHGQESQWPEAGQAHYNALLSKAKEVVVVCEGGYARWKFYARDKWMVDHADVIFALWSGIKKSGTTDTVLYAKKKNKQVINLWEDWNKWLAQSRNSCGQTKR